MGVQNYILNTLLLKSYVNVFQSKTPKVFSIVSPLLFHQQIGLSGAKQNTKDTILRTNEQSWKAYSIGWYNGSNLLIFMKGP